MPRQFLRRTLQGLALWALVCLGLALVQDAFLHTDDGCVIETHCVACLWHHGALVVSTVVPRVAPATVPVFGPAEPPASEPPTDGAPRTAPSRGPPLV